MTERSIQRALSNHFSNYDYRLFNAFVYAWESDFFCLSKSGYAIEVEIKISRSDFRNDFKNKVDKHHLLSNRSNDLLVRGGLEFKGGTNYQGQWYQAPYTHIYYDVPQELLPNRFFYAVPEGLITAEECPEYAGLLYVRDQWCIIQVKQAPLLHKNKRDLTKVLLNKFYHRSNNMAVELQLFCRHIEHSLNDDQKERMDKFLAKLV